MKLFHKQCLLGFLAFISPILFFVLINNQPSKKVLRLIIKPTPTPKPTSTPSPTPTSTPTPTNTPTPSPSPTPSPKMTPTPASPSQPIYTSEQINTFIERFAAQYGVDPNVLRHIAICESNLNQTSINGPYAGLYQFDSNTWKNNRQLMGEDTNPDLRLNAEEAVQTAAFVISIGRGGIWPNCFP